MARNRTSRLPHHEGEEGEERHINIEAGYEQQQRRRHHQNRNNAPDSAENYHTMEFTRPPVALAGGTATDLEEFRTVVLPPPTRLPSEPRSGGAAGTGTDDIDSYRTVVMPPPTRLPTASKEGSADIDSYKTMTLGPPTRIPSGAAPVRPGQSLVRSTAPVNLRTVPPQVPNPVQNQQVPNVVRYRHISPSDLSNSHEASTRVIVDLTPVKLIAVKVLFCSLSAIALLVAIALLLIDADFRFKEHGVTIYLLVAAGAGAVYELLQTLLLGIRLGIGKPLFQNSWFDRLLAYIFDQAVMIVLATAGAAASSFLHQAHLKGTCSTSSRSFCNQTTISTALTLASALSVLGSSVISSYMLFSNKI